MRICSFTSAKATLLTAAVLVFAQPLAAQPNSWINSGSGFWQDAFNWSLGPPNFFQSMFITNEGIKNVLIDNNTSINFPATMTVSNLTVSRVDNTLMLNSAGLLLPLHIQQQFDLRDAATLQIFDSALQVDSQMHVDGTNTFFNFLSGWAWISNMVIGSPLSTNCLVKVQADGSLFATNATQNAFVDVAHGGSLTLDRGFLQADTLILTNGGAFNDLAGNLISSRPFQVEGGSSFLISNAIVSSLFNFTLGAANASIGTLQVLDGGLLQLTAALGIGNNGTTVQGVGLGLVTVSNATLLAPTINLGSSAGGVGGLLIQSNGNVSVGPNFNVVSGSLLSTSLVTVIDGNLVANTGQMRIGFIGSGRMDIFGGHVTLRQLILGSASGLGSGGLYMNGGSLQVTGAGTAPNAGINANFIIWEGGDLDGTGTSLTIGNGHASVVRVSGNFVGRLAAVYAGVSPGYLGAYQQSGGTVYVSTNFIVGGCSNNAPGSVVLSGGTLYVTNAAHTAVLDARNGSVTIEAGGTLVVDTIVVTNWCGHVIKRGGTLIMHHPPILDPDMDADNTGQSNRNKAAAGLDPFDPNSVFKTTGVTRVNGTDVRIEWTTQGGHSYVVQTATTLDPTAFQDLSPVIPAQAPGAGTATYFDIGGATTTGSRLYRVRLAGP